VWNIDRYIEDAERDGDTKTAELWRAIRIDIEGHVKMIRERINELVSAGTF